MKAAEISEEYTRTMVRGFALIAMVSCVLVPRLSGQKLAEVEVGERLRVYAAMTNDTRRGWIEGVLVSIDSNSLVLKPARQPAVAVPQQGLRSVQEYAGQQSRWGFGLLIGALGGTLAGGMTGAALVGDCAEDGSSNSFCGTNAVLQISAGSLIAGSAIGAVTGLFTKVDRWTSIPFDRFRLGFPERPDGAFSLRIGISF